MAQASTEKLEHTGPAKKEKGSLSATKRAVGKYARAVCPEHQIVWKAFSIREVKRTAAEKRKEKETSIPLQKDSESWRKKQSHPNELSENSRKGDVRWGERPEKEGRLVELVGDQNPGYEASPKSKIGRERKEQRRCQGRSDCQRSDKEE